MSLTLYVREDCHDCDKVITWMRAQKFDFNIDDIDAPKDPALPTLFIAPALCKGHRVLAYGIDIIVRLENVR